MSVDVDKRCIHRYIRPYYSKKKSIYYFFIFLCFYLFSFLCFLSFFIFMFLSFFFSFSFLCFYFFFILSVPIFVFATKSLLVIVIAAEGSPTFHFPSPQFPNHIECPPCVQLHFQKRGYRLLQHQLLVPALFCLFPCIFLIPVDVLIHRDFLQSDVEFLTKSPRP